MAIRFSKNKFFLAYGETITRISLYCNTKKQDFFCIVVRFSCFPMITGCYALKKLQKFLHGCNVDGVKTDEDKLKIEIGARIASLREAAGKKQGPVAAYLGRDVTTYRTREQGLYFFPIPELIKLPELFGVSLDYILTGADVAGLPEEDERECRLGRSRTEKAERLLKKGASEKSVSP